MTSMIDIAPMSRFPKGIPEAEIVEILAPPGGSKIRVAYRLSPEAVRIIEEGAKRYGIGKNKALEIIIREARESWKKGKK